MNLREDLYDEFADSIRKISKELMKDTSKSIKDYYNKFDFEKLFKGYLAYMVDTYLNKMGYQLDGSGRAVLISDRKVSPEDVKDLGNYKDFDLGDFGEPAESVFDLLSSNKSVDEIVESLLR